MQLSNISNDSVTKPTRFLRHWGDDHCWDVSGVVFCQRGWQWIFPCRLNWCLQICQGMNFIPLWPSNSLTSVCTACITKGRLESALPVHQPQGPARVHSCPPLQWYCFKHLTLLAPFLFRRSIGDECANDSIVNWVLKLRLLNAECKKNFCIWIQFLEMLWRRSVRLCRGLLKNIWVIYSHLKNIVNFRAAKFSHKKKSRNR